MQYRNIGGTTLVTSAICMGSVAFCSGQEPDYSYGLLDTYTELGGNFIDTANVYGRWLPDGRNISEAIIGSWLSDRKNRGQMIIGTKGGHPHLSSMHISRLSRREVEADLDESLKTLQTDYIDLYWLHRDDEKLPAGEIIEYLNDFVKMGKIRYFGCSNWKARRVGEAQQYAKEKGIASFAGNQMFWNLAKLNEDPFDDTTLAFMDEDMYRLHLETQLTAIPYTSQANGFFEKLDRQQTVPLKREIKRAYYNQENLERYERIKKISKELSVSITEIVLGYLLSQPFTTIPIIGCSSQEQLKISMKAGDLQLDREVVNYLRDGA